jgi:histidinol-phosphate aminotransferase
VLLTNGSDEALFLAAWTFLRPGVDVALTSSPTFDMIGHYIRLCEARLVEVPVLPQCLNFDIVGLTQALATDHPKLLVLASPDNPTGATVSKKQLAAWLTQFPQTLFVLDEAYAEYVRGEETAHSVLSWVGQYPNLLVTRTFSKAWGLAGLRLGAMAGPASLLSLIRRVQSPFSVNAMAVEAVEQLFVQQGPQRVRAEAQAAMDRKDALMASLEARGYRVHAGAANFFLLFAGADAERLSQWCASHGVLVRNRSHLPGLQGAIRISVGREEENAALLTAVDAYRQHHAVLFDIDDTLVDTRDSFDVMVMRLMTHFSGSPISREALTQLRLEGGYNDDWDATIELLRRREISVTRPEVAEMGRAIYQEVAPDNEHLIIQLGLLGQLKKRYRLAAVTGRHRPEYDPYWHETFRDFFEVVVCRDDYPHLPAKPAPHHLQQAMAALGIAQPRRCVYIGNSVDDMAAGRAAGMDAWAVRTTQPEASLRQAGATGCWENINALLAQQFGWLLDPPPTEDKN